MPDSIDKINGRHPINSKKYAGTAYSAEHFPLELSKKYPDGIVFSSNGFPDYSPYAIIEIHLDNLTGDYRKDLKLANEAVGITEKEWLGLNKSYTWHHVENGKTLQLVPKDLHKNVKHTGGRATINEQKLDSTREPPPIARDSIIKQSRDIQQAYQQERRLALQIDHQTSRTLNAASLAVDVAKGDYAAAVTDTAALAVDNKHVQQAAINVAEKVGAKTAFNRLAKVLPLSASYMAYKAATEEEARLRAQGRPDLAEAAYQTGKAEILGGILGGWSAEGAREITREAYIQLGGKDYEQLAHAGSVEIGIEATQLATDAIWDRRSKPVTEILPETYRSMTLGGDAMGERSDVVRIAVERTGIPAGDPKNTFEFINSDQKNPKAHILILEDGRVQGPADGGVPFDQNPAIAAGKNGETIGVLYAGQGKMTPQQSQTLEHIKNWLTEIRRSDGLTTPIEVIGGSTATADLLDLPTPRGQKSAPTINAQSAVYQRPFSSGSPS